MNIRSLAVPFLVTISVALAGCATTGGPPSDFQLDASGQEGLAVVALTLSGEALKDVSDYRFRIRPVAPAATNAIAARRYFDSSTRHAQWAAQGGRTELTSDERTVIVRGPGASALPEISDGGKEVGRLASLRLPPGRYELFDWTVRKPDDYGGVKYAPARSFSYPFTVKPGQIVYIGQLNLHLTSAGGRLSITDERARDLAQLAITAPTLPAASVEIGTLSLYANSRP